MYKNTYGYIIHDCRTLFNFFLRRQSAPVQAALAARDTCLCIWSATIIPSPVLIALPEKLLFPSFANMPPEHCLRCLQVSVTKVVHKDRRAAMLQKAEKTTMQTASLAKGGAMFLCTRKTKDFSLGMMLRIGDDTISHIN